MADLPAPTVDPEEARRIVARVLSGSEYSLEPTLWERLQEAVVRGIGELWLLLAGTGQGTLIGAVVLALLLAGIALLVWRLLRGMRRDAAAEMPLAGDVGRSPAQWRQEAAEHEAAGRWRQAVRCLYRAVIAELASRGQLEEVPGRTAGEYLQAVRRDLPALADPFTTATLAFEAAWYGPGDVAADDVAAMRQAAARIEPAVAGRSGER